MRAAAALEAAGVPCAVTGGNAVAAWVARVDESAVRNTRDADILLRRADLPAAVAAPEKAGFMHRRISSLGKPGTLDVFLDGPDAKPRDAVRVVFANERARPDNEFPAADMTESKAVEGFRLTSLEALARMKLTAFRDKDRVHLRDLVEVGLLDDALIANLPPLLRERLNGLLSEEE